MASTINAVEYGANQRNWPIHAPDRPSNTSSSGSTQQVEASSAATAASASAGFVLRMQPRVP